MIALTALLGFVGLAVGYGLGVAMAGCSREDRAQEHREALDAAYSRGYVQGCKSPAAGLEDFDELLSFGGNAGDDTVPTKSQLRRIAAQRTDARGV